MDRNLSDFTDLKIVFPDWQYIYPGQGKLGGKSSELHPTGYLVPKGIKLEVFQPHIESTPVFRHEKPWELGYICGYSTVIRDGGKLKLYYEVFHQRNPNKWTDFDSHLCYAESVDGQVWHRPELGIVEFKGDSKNNILVTPETNPLGIGIHGSSIFVDPHAGPDQRYKMNYCGLKSLTYGASSPDGIHWTFGKDFIADTKADSQNIIYWDDNRHKYVGYFRTWFKEHRGIVRGESDDFWNWPPYEEFTKLYISDPNLTPDCDYYTNGFQRWLGTEKKGDAYIMLPSIYHRTEDYLDTELYVSRTGLQWFRPLQNPIVIPRRDHLFPQGALYFGNGLWEDPLTKKWVVFCANFPHNHNDPHPSGNVGGLYKAQFRPDGFMGISGGVAGEFWTIQFRSKSPTIQINALTMNAGQITVGLYDTWRHTEIEGYTTEDCDPLRGDLMWKTLSWNGESDLSDYDDAYLRLHVRLTQATLFAIRFV